MKSGKSVGNGSNGRSMSRTMIEGLAQASKGFGCNKGDGSLGLAPNVMGETHEPFQLACGFSTAPNVVSDAVKVPDPEVKVRRRYHTRKYKIGILKEADKLKGKPGALGELLRREGLYSSALAEWRRQRNEGSLGQTRGRKQRPAEVLEIEKLKKRIAKIEEKNRQYVLVIEAQKKMSEILGIRQDNVPPIPEDDEDE